MLGHSNRNQSLDGKAAYNYSSTKSITFSLYNIFFIETREAVYSRDKSENPPNAEKQSLDW